LTHDDHVPFVGGTYFPKTPRYGMPAFTDILLRVSDHYRQHPDGSIRGKTRPAGRPEFCRNYPDCLALAISH
jgi:uncharacterized protein YyaL (SSP411 family)